MMSSKDTNVQSRADMSLAHDLCESAVDYVLNNVNTVQYLVRSIEEITGASFTRDRIKCLPMVPALFLSRVHAQTDESTKRAGAGVDGDSEASRLNARHMYAGYMWNRARPDCDKGDVVLIEDHLLPFSKYGHMVSNSSRGVKNSDSSGTGDQISGDSSIGATPSSDSAVGRDECGNTGLWIAQESAVLTQVERNLRHELLHAFDDARGYIDPSNCMHQACSEIRAARLSGDCFAGEELKRGRWNYFSGGQQCVRRRARTAVEMNPLCRGFGDRAVDSVFRSCYSDYEPFAAPIYAMGSYGADRFENGTLNSGT